MFALAREAREDSKSIDLTIGAFRDEEGKPWKLPAVAMVRMVVIIWQ